MVVFTTLRAEALEVDTDDSEFKISLGYTASRGLVLQGIQCHLYNQPWVERNKKFFKEKVTKRQAYLPGIFLTYKDEPKVIRQLGKD